MTREESGDPDLDRLCRLVGWNSLPIRNVDWAATEAEYGLVLPSDFKEYSSVFPTGVQLDVLTVPTPENRSDGSGMPEDIIDILEIIRSPSRTYGDIRGEPFTPAELLPWGNIGVDYLFCWVTRGAPDDWPVAVCTFELANQFVFQGRMVKFLKTFVDGTVCPPGLEYVLEGPRVFAPRLFDA